MKQSFRKQILNKTLKKRKPSIIKIVRGSFFGFFTFLVTKTSLALATSEKAMEMEAASSSTFSNAALYAISSGVAIGLAAFGGALGQGKLGAAAMEGIARNPQAQKEMFVPLFMGLVLIESLVIYAFVIAFLLQGKI